MQARFCYLCDDSRAEGDPLFLPVVDYWAHHRLFTNWLHRWRPKPDIIVRVAGTVLLESTVVYRAKNVDTVSIIILAATLKKRPYYASSYAYVLRARYRLDCRRHDRSPVQKYEITTLRKVKLRLNLITIHQDTCERHAARIKFVYSTSSGSDRLLRIYSQRPS